MAAFDADRAHGHVHAHDAACACAAAAAEPDRAAEATPAAAEHVYGHDERGFEPREAFGGARRGFVFTRGRLGTGYYRDRDPARPHACGCGKAFTTAQNLRRHRESPKCPLRPSDPGVSKS